MMLKSSLLLFSLLFICILIRPDSWSDQPDQSSYRGEVLFNSTISEVYKSLREPALNPEAFRMALSGYRSLCAKGLVSSDSLITIIDYTLPSSEERFFVINLRQNSIIYKTLVAHGRNSGELYATRFSNRAQSYQSAIGFYITGAPYMGGQGYSLLLTGVDTGYNDQARMRSIVIHGARYATPQYVRQYGRLGRSFGCPALPPYVTQEIINCIRDGSVLFSYYPDRDYIQGSVVLGAAAEPGNDPETTL
jgi:hypothetical protein